MRHARHCRGSAILLVLLFIFVLTTTGIAIMYMNGRQEIVALNDIKEMAAYQAAQSGLELARGWFMYKCSGSTADRFPEHIYDNKNTIIVSSDATHTDGTWELSNNITNPGQGTTSFRVCVTPYPNNDVNIMGNTGVMGNYVVVSTGIVSTGISGSYDYIKVTSETVRVHYVGTTSPYYFFRVVGNSWVEEPLKRVVHP